jgi:hypothetical protein
MRRRRSGPEKEKLNIRHLPCRAPPGGALRLHPSTPFPSGLRESFVIGGAHDGHPTTLFGLAPTPTGRSALRTEGNHG